MITLDVHLVFLEEVLGTASSDPKIHERFNWCDEKDWQACGDKSCGSHLYVELARELGIEVDDV